MDAPRIGALARGPRDAITDVAGVTVGHCTLDDGAVQTGVTVVRPHGGDAYRDRVPATGVVLNGFGKSVGLMQVEELGVLETPIVLTNTYSVPAMAAALIRDCVSRNPEAGRGKPTVNPLVFECNDGWLDDMQRMVVGEEHFRRAMEAASADVAQGSVGAGRGMSSFGLKGGIGTASRLANIHGHGEFTVGALVLSNFGAMRQLTIAGRSLGDEARRRLAAIGKSEKPTPEQGSIILLSATDAPLDARQLRRLALRAGTGLARTGSTYGHGSGDIALAFTTSHTVPQEASAPRDPVAFLPDALLDPLFQAVADATEQAIVNALCHATPVTGRDGHRRHSLSELFPEGLGARPESP